MRRLVAVVVGVLLLFPRPLIGRQSPEATTLKITQGAATYTLTVAVSRLVMTIPKGGLRIQRRSTSGAANSPRYFHFADQAVPQLNISGWFESADGFTDMESFWRRETAAWKRNGVAAPQNVAFEHIGNWDAVLYDMRGSDVTNANIRAHWVQSGTWIDIHLSLTGRQPVAVLRRKLRKELEAISVAEKQQ